MANTSIQIKKSGVTGNTPSGLNYGELALNYADKKLYFKNGGDTISYINNQDTFATINANNSLILAVGTSDTLSIQPGNNISIVANTTTKTITINSTASGGGDGGGGVLNYWQNTAPSTANSHDFWTNSDTGVMYENFGTPSSPIWAEVGPTSSLSNTQPGLVTSTQLTVGYSPLTTSNAAIMVSAANTQGGNGYADFLKVTNTSGGATNTNKYFRLTTEGKLEVINSAYSASLFGLDNNGNLQIAGAFTPSTWNAGQVIKDTVLSHSDLTQIQQGGNNRFATDTYNRDFVTYSYTPVSSSSYLVIEFYLAKYDATSGTGNDSWFTQMKVNATSSYSRDGNGVGNGLEIMYGWQSTVNGNRSGCLFPLLGRYTNSDTNAKTIAISGRRDSADDYVAYDWTSTSVWMRITEIAR